MPEQLPPRQQSEPSSQISVAIEVRELRLQTRLSFWKLARMAVVCPSMLCDWENGRRSLAPARQRRVRALVRSEFAKHVARDVELARRHGIAVRAP